LAETNSIFNFKHKTELRQKIRYKICYPFLLKIYQLKKTLSNVLRVRYRRFAFEKIDLLVDLFLLILNIFKKVFILRESPFSQKVEIKSPAAAVMTVRLCPVWRDFVHFHD
jgi:hypothetical protein